MPSQDLVVRLVMDTCLCLFGEHTGFNTNSSIVPCVNQRLVYFDQAIHYCCVMPVDRFIKGTISIFVFNRTASLIES